MVAAATTAGWVVGYTVRGCAVFTRAGTTIFGPSPDASSEAIAEVHERLRWADRLAARWRR